MSSGSRTGTPQPWQNGSPVPNPAGGGGLQLPQQPKGEFRRRFSSREKVVANLVSTVFACYRNVKGKEQLEDPVLKS
jgi:hypothetical protein